MKSYDICIIGAGSAAGFFLWELAALAGARVPSVAVIERNARPFKKIEASGNGRCNYSNRNITIREYFSFSASGGWLDAAFRTAAELDLEKRLAAAGVPSRADEYGRLFPFTNSARTVSWLLVRHLENTRSETFFECNAHRVEPSPGGFTVSFRTAEKNGKRAGDKTVGGAAGKRTRTGELQKRPATPDEGKLECRFLVFAAGGSAYPQLGTDGTALEMLHRAGHSVIQAFPAIVPLEAAAPRLRELSGIKTEALIRYGAAFERTGEVLFTDHGISGPNALYLSPHLAGELRSRGRAEISLDLLAFEGASFSAFERIREASADKSALSAFGGALDHRLLKAALAHAGSPCAPEDRISANALHSLYRSLRDLRVTITGTRPFAEAQVSLGGVSCGEIDPAGFSSNIQKNLYVIGEALDLTGGCGGYNIHLAAAEGMAASRDVMKKLRRS